MGSIMSDAEYEVRMHWTGGLVCTPEHIKMIRFNLQMKQHFEEQKREHELKLLAMKLGLISFDD